MIGMQSSLDRILSLVQNTNMPAPQGAAFSLPPHMETHRDGAAAPPRPSFDPLGAPSDRLRSFPPLPGFAPPVSFDYTRHS